MLKSATPSTGARYPRKSPKIPKCDAFSVVLILFAILNPLFSLPYNPLVNRPSYSLYPTNPHCTPQNALKLAKTQPRGQRQGAQALSFQTLQTPFTTLRQL